jgi:hypothetical protein
MNDNIIDIGKELGEVALDQFISNPILKEIPGLSVIQSIFKVGMSISDYLFINKLKYFLDKLSEINENEINKMLKKLDKDTKNTIGLNLMIILNQTDHIEKAAMIGSLFVLRLKKEITEDDFYRVSNMINRCFYSDLLKLKHIRKNGDLIDYNRDLIPAESLFNLYNHGLLIQTGISKSETMKVLNSNVNYQLNHYAEIIKKIL